MEKSNKSKFKRIIKDVLFIVFLMTVFFNGYATGKRIAAKITNEPLIFFFGENTSVVASESMEPLLMVGDKVIIKPLKSTDDVVISTSTDDFDGVYVYVDRGHYDDGKRMLIVHRCVGIDSKGNYIFKGDNNDSVDRLTVSRDDVVGKVVKITPFGSKIDIINYTFLLFDIIYIVFSFDKKQSAIINNSGNKN